MSALRIPGRIRDELIAHAREGFPLEVCGILGGAGSLVSRSIRVRNVRTGRDRFLMDPREQIAAMDELAAGGLQVLAFYHSHPLGPAEPSAEDIRLAFYPETATVIVSLENGPEPVLAAFFLDRENSSCTPLEIIFGK